MPEFNNKVEAPGRNSADMGCRVPLVVPVLFSKEQVYMLHKLQSWVIRKIFRAQCYGIFNPIIEIGQK